MDLNAEISGAWAEHGDRPEAVLERLPTLVAAVQTPAHAAALTRFIRHFVGEERQDWPEALAMCTGAVSRAGPGPALALAEGDRAVAALLAGDAVTAMIAQGRGIQHDPANAAAHLGRIQFHAAAALLQSPRPAGALELARAALDLLACIDGASPVDRDLAIGTNNLCNWLREQPRAPETDALMVAVAQASLALWGRAGTWVNQERALYGLALVYDRLERHAEAQEHAERGLQIIAANGADEVDEAFLRLSLSRSLRLQGEDDASRAELGRADALAAAFDAGLKSWFDGERARANTP